MTEKLVAIDTETFLIEPGLQAPPLVCLSYCYEGGGGALVSGVVPWTEAKDLWLKFYNDGWKFVGHNIAYDYAVLAAEFPDLIPSIFDAYSSNRVHDTMIRQKLLDIAEGELTEARGKYSLAALAKNLLGETLEKDEWRLRYAEFRSVPFPEWPAGAIEYARKDAETTFRVFQVQKNELDMYGKDRVALETNGEEIGSYFKNEFEQVRTAWWQRLVSVWGLKVGEGYVVCLRDRIMDSMEQNQEKFIRFGLINRDWKINTKRVQQAVQAVYEGFGKPCPVTEKGLIACDELALSMSGEDVLVEFAEWKKNKSVLDKDIPMLFDGASSLLNTSFNGPLATGRVSTHNPNIQNFSSAPGARECVIPRPGMLFAAVDYDGWELRTLAQVCKSLIGYSLLGDAILEGKDPHLIVASQVLYKSYEDTVKLYKEGDKDVKYARKLGKEANFGFPGGMGISKFRDCALKKGIELSEDEVRTLKRNWLDSWPEMVEYFNGINSLPTRIKVTSTSVMEVRDIEQLFSGRIRGGCTYTQACNTLFQGLGADASCAAGYLISKACYVDTESVLYGSRIVNYIHDEFILEVPANSGHECAFELSRLMVEGAKPWLPDIPPSAKEPKLMAYWSKDAKALFDSKGRLYAWR